MLNIYRHYDDFHTPSFRADTGMLCGNEGKRRCDEERWICYTGDTAGSSFTIMGIDPSLALGMTISVSCHHAAFPQSSFRTEARMLCGNKGKGLCDTEWWICYSDDSLPSSSSCQQILHIRSGWRFTVFLATAADSSLIYIMVPSALSVLWLLPFAKERGALKFKIFSPKLLTRKSLFAKIITIFKSADGKK